MFNDEAMLSVCFAAGVRLQLWVCVSVGSLGVFGFCKGVYISSERFVLFLCY